MTITNAHDQPQVAVRGISSHGTADDAIRLIELVNHLFDDHPDDVFMLESSWWEKLLLSDGHSYVCVIGRNPENPHHVGADGGENGDPIWGLTAAADEDPSLTAYSYPDLPHEPEAWLSKLEQLQVVTAPDVPYGIIEDGKLIAIYVNSLYEGRDESGRTFYHVGSPFYLLEGLDKPSLFVNDGRVTQRLMHGISEGWVIRLSDLLTNPRAKAVYVWDGEMSYLTFRSPSGSDPRYPNDARWLDWAIRETQPGESGRRWENWPPLRNSLTDYFK